ncbi:MAG: cbb3-type cytochrome c oxidase subunit I [Armatimonadetes bacterium]|nr:cbb3-type cytochrome c oxidase subunit I [Armatimonadota bacterium]
MSTITSFRGDGAGGNGAHAQAAPASAWRRLWDWMDRPDTAALHALLSGAVWFFVFASVALVMSNELVQPELFGGIPYMVFSRLRPAHVLGMIFGFLGTSFYGAWYFLVPRLCRAPLRTNRAANLVIFFWNLGILLGSVALMNGDTHGKEYAEYPWYVAWALEILLAVNASIIYGTIAARREPKLYVSLWYIGGTVIWIMILIAVGMIIWRPFTMYQTLPDGQWHYIWTAWGATPRLPSNIDTTSFQWTGSLTGLNDAVWNWFHGHNVLGLYVTTGGLAIVYYLVPKISKRPLYSHTLSLIGFWSIALLYTNTGQHHLLQAPIPNWLKVVAIIGSISLIVPVFSFITNLFMTMRGAWGLMLQNISLRFLLTGAFFYLAVSFQGCVQSLMTVNRFIHFTQWTVAHAHLALLGAFGFIAMGAMMYMVPQIVRRPLWSLNLADAQYWLILLGITGYFWSITVAGLVQSSDMISIGAQWLKFYPVVKPYFVMRSWFGGMIWIGVIMQLVNLYMTVRAPAPDAAARRRMAIADLQELAPGDMDERAALAD